MSLYLDVAAQELLDGEGEAAAFIHWTDDLLVSSDDSVSDTHSVIILSKVRGLVYDARTTLLRYVTVC